MKKCLILVFAMLFCSEINAQKVGVVLSGGGAKGLYHIGILKALEENNIPIDYISGTSMGAIIGGLYASGYTPLEIEKIFLGPNVESWISGKMVKEYSYFYNELPPRPTMVTYKIDIKNLLKSLKWRKQLMTKDHVPAYYDNTRTVATPVNLVSSTQLDMGLMDLFSGPNAVSSGDFDNLFIPFRCVSVDAVTKTQRVWNKGDMSLAIRASMSIPIVFNPVIIDSTVMFDGSVLNNFPWKETVEEWNPDFIIGGRCVAGDVLDVSTPIGQAMALMFSPTDYNLPDSLGVMIGRSVNVGALDFTKAEYVIDLGYKDAMKKMPELLRRVPYFISQDEREQKRLEFKKRIPVLVFDQMHIDDVFRVKKKVGKNADLRNKKKSDKKKTMAGKDHGMIKDIDVKTISDNYFKAVRREEKEKIVNIDELSDIYYRVITEGSVTSDFPYADYVDSTGLFNFRVNLDRNPVLKISGGLIISSASVNQLYVGASYRTSKRITAIYNIDGYIGSFYSAGQISSRFNFYRGERNIYMYNTLTYNFFNFSKANYQRYGYDRDLFSKESTLNEIYFSSLVGMPIGIKNKFEIRLAGGLDNFGINVASEIGPDTDLDEGGGEGGENENANRPVDGGPDPSPSPSPVDLTNSAAVRFGTINVRISTSSMDDINYPTSGVSQLLSATGTYAEENVNEKGKANSVDPVYESTTFWGSMKFSRTQYLALSKRFSLGYMVEGVLSSNPKFSANSWLNMAPKFEPTLFSKTVYVPEFQKYNYMSGGIMPVFKILENFELRAEAFIYWGDFLNKDVTLPGYMLSATLVYKLPFASISLSYNRLSSNYIRNDFVMFNFGVMLFNPRGVVY